MPRFRLTIEYDGAPFAGWQYQADASTVQGVLEAAVARINGQPSTVQGAGRTDAGVHALAQVAHVDLSKNWDPFTLRNAINANVRPHPVSVLEAVPCAEDFHARFSAMRRHYLYRILNRRSPPALDKGKVWWLPMDLDAGAMHEAAQHLIGKHDFTTFRAAQCQAQSPVKTLDRLDVARYGELIEIRADARSFLHNQVRSMVGTLKLVGEGKWRAREVKAALVAKDRARCGPVSPPEGLYLLKVDY
ncbi:tRNA pseudouridine(38-40) synthase TruA [Aestuariivirga sp.]|uniref:tRNA pseudouridine(38-40) synthase TruA n=1 Tax=Aestuariivirga sp. TaxID=2650926 RepID=UPI0039E38CDC